MDYKCAARSFGMLDRRTRAYITLACEKWHIGFSEYVILENLYGLEGCIQEELAGRILSDKTIIARALKTLEEKEFVERRQDKSDRRMKCIYLTEKARLLENEMDRIARTWIDKLAEGVDDVTVEYVLKGLQIVAAQAAAADLRNIGPSSGGNGNEKKS